MQADELADVIIARKPGLTSWTLQKLLYYVEAWHLAITNTPIFTDDVFRGYKDGPVLETVYRSRKDPMSRRHPAHLPELTELQSTIVELVLNEYGGRSGDELSALTHTEAPWLEAREGLGQDDRGRREISNESIAQFFRDRRQLGGRAAGDLAAGGLFLLGDHREPDMSQFLAEDDDWPSSAEAHDVAFWSLPDAREHASSRRSV